jgi:hypothetical protein
MKLSQELYQIEQGLFYRELFGFSVNRNNAPNSTNSYGLIKPTIPLFWKRCKTILQPQPK